MKNIKNNKGITLMALVITIIILIILASIGTYSGIQVVKSAQFTAFSTELKIMQTQVNKLYEEKKNGNTEYVDGLGIAISSKTDVQEQANKVFTALGITTDTSDYKYFDINTIKSLNIEGVEGEFFVNVDKRSVVSYDGFEYEGTTYYTINQLENNSLYNVEYKEDTTNKPTFDFSVERLKMSEYLVSVSNIEYNGNINKWNLEYKKEEETEFKEAKDLNVKLYEEGTYILKIANGDFESEERPAIVREPQVGDRVKYEDVLPQVTSEQRQKLVSDLATYSGNVNSSRNTFDIIKQEKPTEGKNDMQWQLLDINEGRIRLISSTPTKMTIGLKGYNGYNNIVYLLDEVCNVLYSSDKGTAQNLKVEDLEKYTTYNYKTGKYGTTKEYSTPSTFYPNIFINEKSLISKDGVNNNGTLEKSEQTREQLTTGISNASSKITVQHIYWKKTFTSDDFLPKYYELFTNGSNNSVYWLSSRGLYSASAAFFEGFYIYEGALNSIDLFSSANDGSTSTGSAMGASVRPIVSLNTSARLFINEVGEWIIQ